MKNARGEPANGTDIAPGLPGSFQKILTSESVPICASSSSSPISDIGRIFRNAPSSRISDRVKLFKASSACFCRPGVASCSSRTLLTTCDADLLDMNRLPATKLLLKRRHYLDETHVAPRMRWVQNDRTVLPFRNCVGALDTMPITVLVVPPEMYGAVSAVPLAFVLVISPPVA